MIFRMDKVVANVFWNADGTLSLDYLLTFTNQPGGHVIDFVDVGLPTNTFDIDDIQADINGNPLKIIQRFPGAVQAMAWLWIWVPMRSSPGRRAPSMSVQITSPGCSIPTKTTAITPALPSRRCTSRAM